MSALPTPGPWLIHASNRIIVQAQDAFNKVDVKDGTVSGDEMPHTICLLRDPGDGFDEDETLANGFLIAAAPELLAACIWAEAAIAPFSKEPAEKSGISMLRAAIAKARGAS